MKKVQAMFVVLMVVMVMLAGNVYASDDKHHDKQGERGKIYGVITEIPNDAVGTWTVCRRKVIVTEDTRIEQEHGKAAVGAYVEIEGYNDGITFTADEIEVKDTQPNCGRGNYSGCGGCAGQGQGQGQGHNRMYDPQTVTTIAGVVEAVEQFTPRKGMSYGIHLRVKTQEGSISVHVGPSGYVEKQDVKIQVGDNIEVKGSKVTFNNEPAIIAAEIKKGDATLSLRDDNGIPKWAGSGMGRGKNRR
ncbi:conserved hypothetical protein, secreted [Candidatus Magnetobacterium bavaricum]|uniref:Uncharacterized protein n=1 Tax=Candidatus Magnetobacterium bavaricum TaxID=29290 RepID=A0A0F3GMH9_9BACT|nr:conserved hypothetical protein, secreted [Candidatus Magnetobacterium bavaricum]